ncbi:MAG: hypothetical protein ACXADU_16255 [Promethearchaeota archaeon]|jgi:hypothetical protein
MNPKWILLDVYGRVSPWYGILSNLLTINQWCGNYIFMGIYKNPKKKNYQIEQL